MVLAGLAVLLAAIASPPNPVTMLSYPVPLLVLAPVCSYPLTSHGGLGDSESNG